MLILDESEVSFPALITFEWAIKKDSWGFFDGAFFSFFRTRECEAIDMARDFFMVKNEMVL